MISSRERKRERVGRFDEPRRNVTQDPRQENCGYGNTLVSIPQQLAEENDGTRRQREKEKERQRGTGREIEKEKRGGGGDPWSETGWNARYI